MFHFILFFAVLSKAYAVEPQTVLQAASQANPQAKMKTGIYSVETGTGVEPHLVFTLKEGRVYKVEANEGALLERLQKAIELNAEVILSFKSEKPDTILNVKLTQSRIEQPFENSLEIQNYPGQDYFEPTYLNNNEELLRLFRSVYSYPANQAGLTDCFNRAHYWARMYQLQYNVYSQKIFIFFTNKYIRENNYKWWYHVAPLLLVKAWPWGGTEYVMDSTFIHQPVSPDQWSRFFADKAKHGCSWGNSIHDYESKKESDDCVLVKATMYHYFPRDLEPSYKLQNWRCWDLTNTQQGLPAPYMNAWDPRFVPNGCPAPIIEPEQP